MRSILALLAAAVLLAPISSVGQTYPDRQVRVVVPYPAGGGGDLSSRIVSEKVSERWGKSIIIENKPGAGGNLGAALVARAKPDGYTILAHSGAIVINPSLFMDMGFETKDVTPVALLAATPFVLVTNAKVVPATTVSEFIAFAKAKSGDLRWATTAKGNPDHLSGELFQIMTGTKMQHIPYKGGSEAILDVIGGRVEVGFFSIPTVLPYLNTGQLRALGVSSTKRAPQLPDVPTIAESGLPGYEVQNWYSIWAPTGTPTNIINTINSAYREAVKHTDVQKRLLDLGFAPADLTPQEFADYVRDEAVKFEKIISTIGLQKQ